MNGLFVYVMSRQFSGNREIDYSGDNRAIIDQKIRRGICIIPYDVTKASYGYPGDDKPTYCSKHKKDGMINVMKATTKR